MSPDPVRFPRQRPLASSVTSVTSVANNEGDNKIILGAVHRPPWFCLASEENSGKPQLGDHLMKGLCYQSSPQMGYLISKWSQSDRTAHQDGRRKGRRKGLVVFFNVFRMNSLINHSWNGLILNVTFKLIKHTKVSMFSSQVDW